MVVVGGGAGCLVGAMSDTRIDVGVTDKELRDEGPTAWPHPDR